MTTLARQKHQPHEREIAKRLGLSDAQLAGLLRIRAGYWPGNAATVLVRKGLAHEDTPYGTNRLTEAGEEMLRRARKMGY